MTTPKLKITKITKPEALEAAKQFKETQARMHQEFAAIQKRQEAELKQFTSEYRNLYRALFRTATDGIVEFPDEAFGKETHVLEVRFVEHGDAYVIEVPQENSESEAIPEILPGPSRIVKH